MNIRNSMGVAIAAGLLITAVGCGGGGGQAMTSPTTPGSATPPASGGPPVYTQVDTVSDVQALAKTTSETSDPMAVGIGGLLVAPTDDETSDPVAVGQ